jgi:hypothetical protein
MHKPNLFVRDWKPELEYKYLAEYFNLDISGEIPKNLLKYDGFLFHHLDYDYDLDSLKSIVGLKPVVIEVTEKGEITEIIDDLIEKEIDINGVYIELGSENSNSRICSIFEIPAA